MGNVCSSGNPAPNNEHAQEMERMRRQHQQEVSKLRDENQSLAAQTKQLRAQLQALEQKLASQTVMGVSQTPSRHGTSTRAAVPQVGDKVLSHWKGWQFYGAKIHSFDRANATYTVDFDDGDQTCRAQKVEHVALDRVPDEEDVGVGSIVLFPQGQYLGNETRSGGTHWHLGEIIRIRKDDDGTRLYDGKHVKGAEEGKWVGYKNYSPTFEGLKLTDLRISPNIYGVLFDDLNENEADVDGPDSADVFISYSPLNCGNRDAVPDPGDGAPPSYELANAVSVDPTQIYNDLCNKGIKCWMATSDASDSAVMRMMKNAKAFIACISNEYANDPSCRNQLNFAKKHIKIPIIPIIVGSGPWDWQVSVVGLYIAGQLYINFQDETKYTAKFIDLLEAVGPKVGHRITSSALPSSALNPANSSLKPADETTDVFISYCWSNSAQAAEAGEIESYSGTALSDPRHIKAEIEQQGFRTWIDIERLESGRAGLFEEIVSGLKNTKVVLAFVSDEYANSQNCRMEFQFALKTLQKPVIPVIVGKGESWRHTVVGMLCAVLHDEVNLQSIAGRDGLTEQLGFVLKLLTTLAESTGHGGSVDAAHAKKTASRVPQPGDRVISHWIKWQFYTAKVHSFDPKTRMFTVDWDDKDHSGRLQPFDLVALDRIPDEDEIGVGSVIFFPQGQYRGDETRTGGVHWHLGEVTDFYSDEQGVRRYSGKHARSAEDGKWVTYKGYNETFTGLSIDQIRISPNIMDMLVVPQKPQ